jgi:hypothetical protein
MKTKQRFKKMKKYQEDPRLKGLKVGEGVITGNGSHESYSYDIVHGFNIGQVVKVKVSEISDLAYSCESNGVHQYVSLGHVLVK